MTTDVLCDEVLAILRDAAVDELPCPTSPTIAEILRIKTPLAQKKVERLVAQGLIRTETQGSRRRVIFPDGAMTSWTAARALSLRPIVRHQDIELPPIPLDTRDLTGRICNDPIVPRQHETWRPVYETASVTLPRLSFLDGATA